VIGLRANVAWHKAAGHHPFGRYRSVVVAGNRDGSATRRDGTLLESPKERGRSARSSRLELSGHDLLALLAVRPRLRKEWEQSSFDVRL
jgi:hypothetical protein